MTDSNIKIVKLDPTGTFIQKDEPKEEEPSIKSVYTEESSSSDEDIPNKDIPTKDNFEELEETDNVQKEVMVNHLGGAEDSSHKSQESQDYQEKEIEKDLQEEPKEQKERNEQTGGYNNNNNENEENEENEETEVFDLTNEKAYDILRGVLEDDNNNNVSDNLALIHQKMTKQNEMLESFVKDFTYSFNEKIRPLQELNETLQNQNKIFERLTSAIERYIEASFESDDESEEEEPLAEKNVEKIIRNVKPVVEEKISVKKFSQRIPTPKVLKH